MISVIIPTHNRKELLRRALKSVSEQTAKDLEIIVVSDGSTDDTEEFLAAYQHDEHRLRFIAYAEKRGANYARNIGIENARGEYLAFLDDDDEWLPKKLELQQRILDSDSEVGLVYTHIDVLDADANHLWFNQCQVQGEALKKALFGGFIYTTSSVMLRKSIADMAGLFDESLPAMQDTDMWIRCCQITKVAVIPEVLTKYYIFTSANGNHSREQIGNSTKRYIDAAGLLGAKYAILYRQYTKRENKERISIIMRGLAGRAQRNHEKRWMRYCAGIALKNKFSVTMLKLYLISFLPGDLAFTLRKRVKAVLEKIGI